MAAHPNPLAFQRGAKLHEVAKIHRLGEERMRAEFVGALHIEYAVLRGEHHNPQRREILIAQPLKDIEAVAIGHLEIQQQQSGKGIL